MNKIITLAAIAAALTATSCTTCNQQPTEEVLTKQDVDKNVREFVYPLPTAFQVTDMLNRIEAAYILDICNDQANAERYLTESKRALNLGIYSADLCYASTYNQQANVMEYTEVIKKLIDELDMTKAVDPELPSKLEGNENNKDESTQLISEAFYDCYDYLNKNDRSPVAIMVVAGSWIEGLYIATNISEYTFENKEMVKIIMSQKEPLNKLMDLLAKYPGNNNVEPLRTALDPLHAIYNSVDESGISLEQSDNIKATISAIRKDIVDYNN
ncbi:MAG: hypothetical protein IKR17_01240 [Bacteroidales bacterium]|nr:hypothetical protein [Bacteroidales bacterium]